VILTAAVQRATTLVEPSTHVLARSARISSDTRWRTGIVNANGKTGKRGERAQRLLLAITPTRTGQAPSLRLVLVLGVIAITALCGAHAAEELAGIIEVPS
jgi:hypothetical protein